MGQKSDCYTITVTFERSRSADLAVSAERYGDLPERERLMRQFRDELQAAYDHDDVAIDGTFEIDTVDGEAVR